MNVNSVNLRTYYLKNKYLFSCKKNNYFLLSRLNYNNSYLRISIMKNQSSI